MILLTEYLRLVQGNNNDNAFDQLQKQKDTIIAEILQKGMDVLNNYQLSPPIEELFLTNPIEDFIHEELFIDFVFGTTGGIRIILSRGEPWGPLGQIDKMEATGVLKGQRKAPNDIEEEFEKQGVDVVVCVRGDKTQVLGWLADLFPDSFKNGVVIYDDRPKDIEAYLKFAKQEKAKISVVRVRHPGSKRAGQEVNAEKNLTTPEESADTTTYDLFEPIESS